MTTGYTTAPYAPWEPVTITWAGNLRCETPKCPTAEHAGPGGADGWLKDFMGRLRCPACVALCMTIPAPPEGTAPGTYEAAPWPRWAACLPVSRREVPPLRLYTGNLDDLWAAMDARHGWLTEDEAPEPTAPQPVHLPPPPAQLVPGPEVAHEDPPAVITELGDKAEEHMAAFLSAHGAHDGETSAFDVPDLGGDAA